MGKRGNIEREDRERREDDGTGGEYIYNMLLCMTVKIFQHYIVVVRVSVVLKKMSQRVFISLSFH